MRDARRRAEEHGHVELLRDIIRRAHEVLALLRIRRLNKGDLRVLCIPAVILLILRGMHTGVVGIDDDETAVHAEIRGSKKRIRRDVKPDELHRAERPRTGDGRAVCHLDGDLFVGRPLAVEGVLILGKLFKYLRAGRARICRTHIHARLIRPAGDGLIARHKIFQALTLLYNKLS